MADHLEEKLQDVTELLLRFSQGDKTVHDELMMAVYTDLRKFAKMLLSRERSNHTLQATALVHEAYLRLVRQDRVQWQNRAHFLGVAAQMMRRILVDHARTKQAEKRGGEDIRIALEDAFEIPQKKDVDLILLDEALTTLAAMDPRQSQIVELRFFGGLSVEETAEVLNISVATVMREWRVAKLWLYQQILKN